MIERLESALKRLDDDELEQVTQLAEALARRHATTQSKRKMSFDWVGALRDCPEKSGIEAQQTAMREWQEMIERNRPK